MIASRHSGGRARDHEIVVVDEDPRDAELIARALRESCSADRIHWVTNTAAAFEYVLAAQLAHRRLPDLILLDVRPPGLTGLNVLRRLKANERTRAAPVVVLAASGDDRCVAESYRLGANSCVVKPAEPEGFMAVIADATQFWLRPAEVPAPE